jgi:hypothetical protein
MEGMDIPEVEGTNIVEEHDHPMNHRLGGGGYEYGRETWPPDEPSTRGGRYEYDGYPYGRGGGYRYSGRASVEPPTEGGGYRYMEDSDMVDLKVVEREHKSVVLVRHWIGDGAERHRWACQAWEELAKLKCSEVHTTFVTQDSNCSTWRRVEKRVGEICVEWVQTMTGIYRGDQIWFFFRFFHIFWSYNSKNG